MQSASRRLGAAVYSGSVGGLSLGCRVGFATQASVDRDSIEAKTLPFTTTCGSSLDESCWLYK